MKKYIFNIFLIVTIFVIYHKILYSEEVQRSDQAVFLSSAEEINTSRLVHLFGNFLNNLKLPLSVNCLNNEEDTRRNIYLKRPQIGILDYNYFQKSAKEYNLNPRLIAERDGSPFFEIAFITKKNSNINIVNLYKDRISIYGKNYKRINAAYNQKFGESLNNMPYLMSNNSTFDSLISLTLNETDIVMGEKTAFDLFQTLYPARSSQLEIIYTHQPLPNQLIFSLDDNKTENTEKNIEAFFQMHQKKHGRDILFYLGYDKWIKIDDTITKQLEKVELLKYSYETDPKPISLALNGDIPSGMMNRTIQDGKIITIVKSGELSIYDDAVSRFEELMKGADIAQYSIDEKMKITETGMINRLMASDIIFTLGSIATVAVKKIAKERPIIFGMVMDPVDQIPGEYVAGIKTRLPLVSSLVPVLLIKRLHKVGVIHTKENEEIIKAEKSTLQADNIQVISGIVNKKNTIQATFKRLVESGIDVLWLYPDNWLTIENYQYVLKKSLEAKIPIIAPSNHFVKEKAFLSVYADVKGVGNQAAIMAKQMLSGEKISEIGIQYPSSTKIACNVTTAKELGLELNRKFLRLCDDVYE